MQNDHNQLVYVLRDGNEDRAMIRQRSGGNDDGWNIKNCFN